MRLFKPFNNNLFVSSLPRLKKLSYAEHTQAYRMSCETYTSYAADDGILLHKYG